MKYVIYTIKFGKMQIHWTMSPLMFIHMCVHKDLKYCSGKFNFFMKINTQFLNKFLLIALTMCRNFLSKYLLSFQYISNIFKGSKPSNIFALNMSCVAMDFTNILKKDTKNTLIEINIFVDQGAYLITVKPTSILYIFDTCFYNKT